MSPTSTDAYVRDRREPHAVRGIVGAAVQAVVSLLAAVAGGVSGIMSMEIHRRLAHGEWTALRYSWERGGWGLALFESLLALLMAAIVFARLSELLVGLIARLFGRRIILGRPYWWDLLIIGVPLLIWAYLAYVANFD